MIRGEPHSPTKINLDILEKYLSKMKLFQKIFASNNEQEKKVKVESSKDDLKDFLEMLKKNKITALNYFKIRRVPKFKIKKVSINEKAKSVNYNYYKYRNNDNTINNNSINKKDNTKNSSIEKTLNKTPLHLNKIRKININKKQYLLSPISSSPLSCRQLVKKKLIKENSLIKGFNSFNCPYEKKCIPKKLYISIRLKDKINGERFNKTEYIKQKKLNMKRFEETLLMKYKLNALERKLKKESNIFMNKITKKNEQKPQLKLRFKHLLSQYK